MSSIEALRLRAETAEQRIAELQDQFNELKQQVDSRDGNVKNIYDDTNNDKDVKTSKSKSDEKEIELPFDSIKDEEFLICESGKDATMTVTICNGEANPPFISAKGINYLKSNFNSNEKDVFVDTYAKCGTTLCIKLVYQIYKAIGKICDGAADDKMSSPWEAVPWIEVDVSQEIYKTTKANQFSKYIDESNKRDNNVRIWKSHAPWINFPVCEIGDLTKIIHVTRNPKDVICSYFNFFQQEPFVKYMGDFNTLFDWFCDGSVVHSNFWDFELAWWRASQKHQSQILWLTFEEIVRIPINSIEKVAKFLNVKLTDDQVKFIAKEISFKKMQKDAENMANSSGIGKVLMNKGTIGRWKEKLSVEQSARMDRISRARFANTDIEFDYGHDEEFAKQFYDQKLLK